MPEISEITCFPLQESKALLKCSCCGKFVHSACLVPPIGDLVPEEWSCHWCKEKTDEYLQKRQAYIDELQKRSIFLPFSFEVCGSSCWGSWAHLVH